MSERDGRVDRCAECGCGRERHHIEQPYACMDCECDGFAHYRLRSEPPTETEVRIVPNGPPWMRHVYRALALVERALRSKEDLQAVGRQTGGNAPELVQGILDGIANLYAKVPSEPPTEAGGDEMGCSSVSHVIARLASPPPSGEPTEAEGPEATLRRALHIPPMGEDDLQCDFAAAVGALRARGRTGMRNGEPGDEDHAASLEALWQRLSNALRVSEESALREASALTWPAVTAFLAEHGYELLVPTRSSEASALREDLEEVIDYYRPHGKTTKHPSSIARRALEDTKGEA